MKKNTIIKDAVALFVITIIAGLALGFVFELTKEPIAAAELKAKMDAYQMIFEEAREFKEMEMPETDALEQAGITSTTVDEILQAMNDSGEMIGYVMSLTSKEGYGGDITVSLGVSLDNTITGMKVISMNETAGLGAKCTDDSFRSQFAGIQSEEVFFTKTGKKEKNEIDAISGATITTKAVTNAVNTGLYFVNNCIE